MESGVFSKFSDYERSKTQRVTNQKMEKQKSCRKTNSNIFNLIKSRILDFSIPIKDRG
ncbi:MAG: hypothetical protein G01um101444_294 [Parcubacteria group bacterium Gr01-1014_44]|nr:MAG: hypothetical protein G01um101444_294 [Parcubacteria group bacterium Gr01-1014_44]